MAARDAAAVPAYAAAMPDPAATGAPGETERPAETSNDAAAVDPATFRTVLRHFATGVTVVTTWSDGTPGEPWGTTANSFASVSLRPPLVLVAFEHNRRIGPSLRATGRYAVSILGEESQALSDCFAGAPVSPSRDEFCGAGWHEGETGLPILDEAIASLECTVVDMHPAGDHDLYIARVDAARTLAAHQLPLLYYCGRYLRIERATQLDLEGKPER